MPFNLERSTVNVKDLLNLIKYDAASPVVFNIDSKDYHYYDLFSQENLLKITVNKIKIQGRVSELNEEDVIKIINKPTIKSTDVNLMIPNSSYYYLITIKIN
jgi:hypothetical protein